MLRPLSLFATLIAASASMSSPSQAAPAASAVQALYGHWKVVGVAVSDMGVQALAANDPSYMGRRLTFSADRLAWDTPKAASAEAPCVTPTIRLARRDRDPDARSTVAKVGGPALRGYSVSCGSGTWGPTVAPSPAIFTFRDGTIALWWYDGGLLKLRRVS